MYESQIIMLYILNLNTAVCQLYQNKTGKNKVKKYDGAKAKFEEII